MLGWASSDITEKNLNSVAWVREQTIPTDTKLYDTRSAGWKIKTRHKHTQTQTYRQNYTKSQRVLWLHKPIRFHEEGKNLMICYNSNLNIVRWLLIGKHWSDVLFWRWLCSYMYGLHESRQYLDQPITTNRAIIYHVYSFQFSKKKSISMFS
jgi:hypothetical protein